MKFAILLSAILIVSCGQTTENVSSSKNLTSENLWAGLVQSSMQRYGTPCGEARGIDQNPVRYDSWVRQRASQRNVCFQIWRGGVTDHDNANLWRDLDVQVHFHDGETWQSEYVSFVDRQGNNARYGTEFARNADPFYPLPNFSNIKLPKRILSTRNNMAAVEATMDFYFTVNGSELKNSQGNPFQVVYSGYAYIPTKPEVADYAGVLHSRISCNNGELVIGSGAGTEYIDIKDAQAATYLLGENQERHFYGTVHMLGAENQNQENNAFSIGFSSYRLDEYGFPIYEQNSIGAGPEVRVFSVADGMRVEMNGYDREGNPLGQRNWIFRNCVRL